MARLTRTTEDFIELSTQKHGTRYDYSLVEYAGGRVDVTLVCSSHGNFYIYPELHLSGKGCPVCSGSKLDTTEFIRRAHLVHGDTFDYSKSVYVKYMEQLTITCRIHGDFQQTPGGHLSGAKCKACSQASSSLRMKCSDRSHYANKLTVKGFILKARLHHGNTYDYSLVTTLPHTQQKVKIICKTHGVFLQTPACHAYTGRGCPKCAQVTRGMIRMENAKQTFAQKATKIHQGRYSYGSVAYVHSRTPVRITHDDHYFIQSPHDHLNGTGCPICYISPQAKGYSDKAIRWLNQEAKLRRIKIQHAENGGEYQLPGTKFLVDGFNKHTNTVFEFHGDAYHGNPKVYASWKQCHPFTNESAGNLYRKTKLREQKIRQLGYNLVVMWENDFKH